MRSIYIMYIHSVVTTTVPEPLLTSPPPAMHIHFPPFTHTQPMISVIHHTVDISKLWSLAACFGFGVNKSVCMGWLCSSSWWCQLASFWALDDADSQVPQNVSQEQYFQGWYNILCVCDLEHSSKGYCNHWCISCRYLCPRLADRFYVLRIKTEILNVSVTKHSINGTRDPHRKSHLCYIFSSINLGKVPDVLNKDFLFCKMGIIIPLW